MPEVCAGIPEDRAWSWSCERCFRGANCGRLHELRPRGPPARRRLVAAEPVVDGCVPLPAERHVPRRGRARRRRRAGLPWATAAAVQLVREASRSLYNGVCEGDAATQDRSIAVLVVFFVVLIVAVVVRCREARTMRVGRRRRRWRIWRRTGEVAVGVEKQRVSKAKRLKRRGRRMFKAATAARAIFRAAAGEGEAHRLVPAGLSIFGLCFQVDWPEEYEVVVRDINAIINLNLVGPPPSRASSRASAGRGTTRCYTKQLASTVVVVALEFVVLSCCGGPARRTPARACRSSRTRSSSSCTLRSS